MPNVMYHFVGRDKRLKGITLERFKLQLDFLEHTYPREEIVVTFDHGTIDHIEHAAPELEKRKLKGIFFILTMVPEEHRVPVIDMQRRLEGLYRTELVKMMCKELKIDYCPEAAKGYQAEFSFYSLEERYLRYLRDHIVPTEAYEGFIGIYFEKMFGDEKTFAAKEYLSWQQIIRLREQGHIIGSHSHDHFGDVNDFAKSLNLIERHVKTRPEYISYPNGVKRISDEDLGNLGIKKAYLSIESGTEPYQIGRIDCNLAHFCLENRPASFAKSGFRQLSTSRN